MLEAIAGGRVIGADHASVTIVERVAGTNGHALVVRHLDGSVRWSALGALGHHELDLPTRGAARRAARKIAGGSTSLSPSMLEVGGAS